MIRLPILLAVAAALGSPQPENARAGCDLDQRQRIRRLDHARRQGAVVFVQRPAFLHGDDLLQPPPAKRALGPTQVGAIQRPRPRFRSGLLPGRQADAVRLRPADPCRRKKARRRHLVCRSAIRRRLGPAEAISRTDQLCSRRNGEGGREEFASIAADGTIYFAGDPEAARRAWRSIARGCPTAATKHRSGCRTSSMPDSSLASP